MNELKVTEVQIIPIKPKDGLVAFASCIINNQFYLGNIAIYTSPTSSDGFRLVFPAKNLPTGKQIQSVYPINRSAYDAVKKAIIQKFEELMRKIGLEKG